MLTLVSPHVSATLKRANAAAGAGSGAFLVYLATNLPEFSIIRAILLYFAPVFSVLFVLSGGFLVLRVRHLLKSVSMRMQIRQLDRRLAKISRKEVCTASQKAALRKVRSDIAIYEVMHLVKNIRQAMDNP